MNKWYLLIAVFTLLVTGLAIAVETGAIENPLGGVTPTATKVDIILSPEVKTALENYTTKTELVCEARPEIICLNLENPKEPFDSEKNPCIEWDDWKALGCGDFDLKSGVCNKWDVSPSCVVSTVPIGINKISVVPLRRVEGLVCYSIKDGNGLLNIEEQCLDSNVLVEDFVRDRLEEIAVAIDSRRDVLDKDVLPDVVVVNVK